MYKNYKKGNIYCHARNLCSTKTCIKCSFVLFFLKKKTHKAIYINTLNIRSAESALTKYHKGNTHSFCWCLSDLQIHGNINQESSFPTVKSDHEINWKEKRISFLLSLNPITYSLSSCIRLSRKYTLLLLSQKTKNIPTADKLLSYAFADRDTCMHRPDTTISR